MKYIYLLIFLFSSSVGFSQTKGITYQAAILNPVELQLPGVNPVNVPLTNTEICLKFGIIDQNDVIEYLETIQTTTDEFGMVNLIIGSGTRIGGYASAFSDIVWNSDAKNLQVHLNPTGKCDSYVEISNQPFTYVPFAMYALNVNLADGKIYIGDINGGAQEVTMSGDVIIDNAGATTIANDAVTTTKILDANVTDSKIATGVDAAKLADGSVSNIELQYINSLTSDAQTQITTNATAIALNTAKKGEADGTASGQMKYWNGTAWVVVAATPNEGATLQMIGGVPTWTGGILAVVPDAPTIGTATAGDAQASVPFTAPASNGGPDVTSYTATSNPGGFTGTLSQSGSGTITVTGLTNGTAYTFTVTATNSVGTSAASAASNSVTPAAPLCGGSVTFTYNGSSVTYGTVSGANSTCWLDRNLGATQVATSSTDTASYGDLYQWGRGADGHQIRTSSTTATLSSSDNPGHGDFITISSGNHDWRSPQNDSLWQGVSGTNNPCPNGYRLPTDAELNAERLSWNSNNAAGAFASPLKLPASGTRSVSSGAPTVGSNGYYWSNTVGKSDARYLVYFSNFASVGSAFRAAGASVRCIKD